ncbi:hypothetical protein IJ847_03120 [Candidatus Saccharibacteria bacterium]|nr:hypothetical protein [Candidatus Saccharibacteria bacterium]
MTEKGGKAKGENCEEGILGKIIRVCFIAGGWFLLVSIVIVFTLGAVRTGVKIAEEQAGLARLYGAETVDLSFKKSGYSYTYSRENENADVDSQLLNEFNGTHGNYVVLKSKERYDALVKLAREHAMLDVENMNVDEDFFKSGVIIAVAKESLDMTSSQIKRVYRDEGYNVYLDAEETKSDVPVTSDDYIYGQISFIKLENVKPNSVTISTFVPEK